MKYSFVVAALIGLITFDQVQNVRATQEVAINNDESADSNLAGKAEEEDTEGHNEQQEKSEGNSDDDEEQIQVNQDDDENEEAEAKSGDDEEQDEDTLIYEGEGQLDHNEEDQDDDEDESHQDENETDVQLDQNEQLAEGQFESLDDSEVNEDMALEMEQLNFEYKPHDVEQIGLNDEEEEQNKEDQADEDDQEQDMNDDTPEDATNVQLGDDFFTPSMDGHAGLGTAVYERVVPARFADNGDDFMVSMIKNYALEGKKEDGTPNGQFFLNEAITKTASLEVLKTHKKLDGKDAEEYMKQYFDRTWAHFDVTKEGKLDVDVLPQFMRFFASDQSLELS